MKASCTMVKCKSGFAPLLNKKLLSYALRQDSRETPSMNFYPEWARATKQQTSPGWAQYISLTSTLSTRYKRMSKCVIQQPPKKEKDTLSTALSSEQIFKLTCQVTFVRTIWQSCASAHVCLGWQVPLDAALWLTRIRRQAKSMLIGNRTPLLAKRECLKE